MKPEKIIKTLRNINKLTEQTLLAHPRIRALIEREVAESLKLKQAQQDEMLSRLPVSVLPAAAEQKRIEAQNKRLETKSKILEQARPTAYSNKTQATQS